MNIPDGIEIRASNNKGRGLFAIRSISAGETIFRFIGRVLSAEESDDESLQIDKELFLESTTLFDNHLNHSCAPNCYIDFGNLDLIAIRDITSGEELTFDYNTSDYDLVATNTAFTCACGATRCLDLIRGFRYLTQTQMEERALYIAPYLRSSAH